MDLITAITTTAALVSGPLVSFFTGTVFRMIWGELSAYLNFRMEHKQELERMRLTTELEQQAHERRQAEIRLQHELGVKVIEVQRDADISRLETEAWVEGVRSVAKPSGVRWIDGWNAMIRPAVATWSVVMMTMAELSGRTMTSSMENICGAALGIYLADRTLMKRGK